MKKLVVMGSIGATIIIVLEVFPNIVSAQATTLPKEVNSVISKLKSSKSISERIHILQQTMKETGLSWFPGYFLLAIYSLIALLLVLLTAGHPS
jgi:hypothetical protein